MDEVRPELRINEANPLTVGMEVRSMSLDRELRCQRCPPLSLPSLSEVGAFPNLSHLSLMRA